MTHFTMPDFCNGLRAADRGRHTSAIEAALAQHNLSLQPNWHVLLSWLGDDGIRGVQESLHDVTLTWRPVPGASCYQVLAGTMSYGYGIGQYTLVATVSDTTYLFDGRNARTEYLFTVAPVDSGGQPGNVALPAFIPALDSTTTAVQEPPALSRKGGRWLFNSPNPFNPETRFLFELDQNDDVSIRIYDTHGRIVRTLVRQHLAAGQHAIRWDGLSDHGVHLPSGQYFVQLRGHSWNDSGKALLLK